MNKKLKTLLVGCAATTLILGGCNKADDGPGGGGDDPVIVEKEYEKVAKRIQALSDSSTYEEVMAVKQAFDALTDADKALIAAADKTKLDNQVKRVTDKKAVAEVEAKLLALSDTSSEEEVKAAGEAFDALPFELQDMVSDAAYENLEKHEGRIESKKEAEEFAAKVKAFPADASLEDKALLVAEYEEKAKDAYFKAYFETDSEAKTKLEGIAEEIETIIAEANAYIKAYGSYNTSNTSTEIQAAIDAYDDLSAEAKILCAELKARLDALLLEVQGAEASAEEVHEKFMTLPLEITEDNVMTALDKLEDFKVFYAGVTDLTKEKLGSEEVEEIEAAIEELDEDAADFKVVFGEQETDAFDLEPGAESYPDGTPAGSVSASYSYPSSNELAKDDTYGNVYNVTLQEGGAGIQILLNRHIINPLIEEGQPLEGFDTVFFYLYNPCDHDIQFNYNFNWAEAKLSRTTIAAESWGRIEWSVADSGFNGGRTWIDAWADHVAEGWKVSKFYAKSEALVAEQIEEQVALISDEDSRETVQSALEYINLRTEGTKTLLGESIDKLEGLMEAFYKTDAAAFDAKCTDLSSKTYEQLTALIEEYDELDENVKKFVTKYDALIEARDAKVEEAKTEFGNLVDSIKTTIASDEDYRDNNGLIARAEKLLASLPAEIVDEIDAAKKQALVDARTAHDNNASYRVMQNDSKAFINAEDPDYTKVVNIKSSTSDAVGNVISFDIEMDNPAHTTELTDERFVNILDGNYYDRAFYYVYNPTDTDVSGVEIKAGNWGATLVTVTFTAKSWTKVEFTSAQMGDKNETMWYGGAFAASTGWMISEVFGYATPVNPEKVAEVEALINNLNDSSPEADVVAAREAYESLEPSSKNAVDPDVYAKLVAQEQRILDGKVDTVIAEINALPGVDDLTDDLNVLSTMDAYKKACSDYKALSDEAKAKVTNADKLAALKEIYDLYVVANDSYVSSDGDDAITLASESESDDVTHGKAYDLTLRPIDDVADKVLGVKMNNAISYDSSYSRMFMYVYNPGNDYSLGFGSSFWGAVVGKTTCAGGTWTKIEVTAEFTQTLTYVTYGDWDSPSELNGWKFTPVYAYKGEAKPVENVPYSEFTAYQDWVDWGSTPTTDPTFGTVYSLKYSGAETGYLCTMVHNIIDVVNIYESTYFYLYNPNASDISCNLIGQDDTWPNVLGGTVVAKAGEWTKINIVQMDNFLKSNQACLQIIGTEMATEGWLITPVYCGPEK